MRAIPRDVLFNPEAPDTDGRSSACSTAPSPNLRKARDGNVSKTWRREQDRKLLKARIASTAEASARIAIPRGEAPHCQYVLVGWVVSHAEGALFALRTMADSNASLWMALQCLSRGRDLPSLARRAADGVEIDRKRQFLPLFTNLRAAALFHKHW
ncbi:hypothetical protein GGD83_002750 [Rhodoblastus sphagnicola]|uniref:hypothetical protein n=1 Tax=Rhodoblastus sphagnicola TaxID=333368 RepID=UPI0011B06065|nr:hypothetical protein [Rhodoblastus sphagnicola]MBB4198939.1 hypothetical protein [Rhodoblastus sphagnicola]